MINEHALGLNYKTCLSEFKTRLILLILVFLYIYLFSLNFENFIAPNFQYFGFRQFSLTGYEVLYTNILIGIVVLLQPTSITKSSEYLNLFLLVFIYYPSSIVFFSVRNDWLSKNDALELFSCFTLCIVLVILFSKIPLLSIRKFKTSRRFYSLTNLFLFCLFFYIVTKSLTNLSIVGISELSKLNESRQSVKVTGLLVYPYLWMVTFFLGFFLAKYKKLSMAYKLCIVSIVYFLLAFSMGAKILLIAPFIFFFIYFWVLYFKCSSYSFVVAFIACFMILNILTTFFPSIGFAISALFTFRTLSISSLSFVIYHDFFQLKPFTHFQHVGLVFSIKDVFAISSNTQFEVLPVALKEVYGLGNFNANFFVNDGYAAYGYVGMVFVSFIYSSIMYVFDLLTKSTPPLVLFMSLAYFGMYLGNVSLFTIIVSHGLIVSGIYLYIFSGFIDAKD